MQKKIDHNSPLHLLSDLMLASFAVLVVAGTYFGLSKLTPAVLPSQRVASVLGVNSTSEKLQFITSNEKLPYVSSSTSTITESNPNGLSLAIKFLPLEQTTYTFSAVTIKNTSLTYKVVQVVPEFSLPNSFTTISVRNMDLTNVLIDSTGEILPLDLSIPPNTTMSLQIIVQPTAAIASPTTLRLGFTERQ